MKSIEDIIHNIHKRYKMDSNFYNILAQECGYNKQLMSVVGSMYGRRGGSKKPGEGIHSTVIKQKPVVINLSICPSLNVCMTKAQCADSNCKVNSLGGEV